MWKSRRLTNLWATMACYRDSLPSPLLNIYCTTLKTKEIFSSETLVDFQQTTRRCIPDSRTQLWEFQILHWWGWCWYWRRIIRFQNNISTTLVVGMIPYFHGVLQFYHCSCYYQDIRIHSLIYVKGILVFLFGQNTYTLEICKMTRPKAHLNMVYVFVTHKSGLKLHW